MPKNIKLGLFVYLIWFIILITTSLVYAIFVNIGSVDLNLNKDIPSFIISIALFILLGFLAGNAFQEKGFEKGATFAIIVVVILALYQFLGLSNPLEWMLIIRFLIYITCSAFGGSLGVNMKAII